jgi:hypothetical protein
MLATVRVLGMSVPALITVTAAVTRGLPSVGALSRMRGVMSMAPFTVSTLVAAV